MMGRGRGMARGRHSGRRKAGSWYQGRKVRKAGLAVAQDPVGQASLHSWIAPGTVLLRSHRSLCSQGDGLALPKVSEWVSIQEGRLPYSVSGGQPLGLVLCCKVVHWWLSLFFSYSSGSAFLRNYLCYLIFKFICMELLENTPVIIFLNWLFQDNFPLVISSFCLFPSLFLDQVKPVDCFVIFFSINQEFD